jgi:hypothetical protein
MALLDKIKGVFRKKSDEEKLQEAELKLASEEAKMKKFEEMETRKQNLMNINSKIEEMKKRRFEQSGTGKFVSNIQKISSKISQSSLPQPSEKKKDILSMIVGKETNETQGYSNQSKTPKYYNELVTSPKGSGSGFYSEMSMNRTTGWGSIVGNQKKLNKGGLRF